MCKFVVNLREILDNVNYIKNKADKSTKVCAVVKANAYGFGMAKICTLLKSSVDYFAVAKLSEFIKYKALNIDVPCIILSPLYGKDLNLAIKEGAEFTISTCTSIKDIEEIAKSYDVRAKVHIKVDTGMSRYGYNSKNLLLRAMQKLQKCGNIDVVGLFTHLYEGNNAQKTQNQIREFVKYKEIVNRYGFDPICHVANSEGTNTLDDKFDMVRVGYDVYTSKDSSHKFETCIREIKQIEKGDKVSYNGKFVAKKYMEIAICGAGYADGVKRALSKKGYVLIRGQRAKILGTICMDSFMVDITNIKKVKLTDKVVIFGKSKDNVISVCEVAKKCGTIPYEIYTGITDRVKRVYIWGNDAGYSRQVWRKKA